MSKRFCPGGRSAVPAALAAMMLTSTPTHADDLKPDFTVVRIDAPKTMKVGLSATFTIIVGNIGTTPGPVEINVEFAGVLEQTDQVRTDNGLACEIGKGEGFGVNTVLHCTGATLNPNAR
jgi:hypothetical protein